MQRFFPSEFGNDVDRVHAVEPAKSAFETKAKIRRAIEATGIPYTCVSSNVFAGYFLPTLAQPGVTSPPRDKVVILGDGNPKDHELVALWEKKIGKTIEKIYVPEDPFLKNIEETPFPVKIVHAIGHSVFVKGDHINFEIEKSFGVEASKLYQDVTYTTVDEYLNQFF
ncbi:hypothetical protein AMTR_s00018p00144420 [Amborella trichopoda]|uniref:NmrA-like domain-containing protein n=1 Tax=Amborella trichopoda TaxID=13333 RepID=W1PKK0_AMBTC|nr:hypothetical protein AMTR_s00018p00144420 [Amborella trichopoda]